jgi:subtilisin-like proprotein convertase family protein
MSGSISGLTVTLTGLTHTYPADLDVLLVGPTGQAVLLMSDAGGAADISNVALTLSATATAALPSGTLSSGTFRPANYGGTAVDTFAAPAPAGPYNTDLAAFNGSSANGTWRLYVVDDAGGDVGTLTGGYRLNVTTR